MAASMQKVWAFLVMLVRLLRSARRLGLAGRLLPTRPRCSDRRDVPEPLAHRRVQVARARELVAVRPEASVDLRKVADPLDRPGLLRERAVQLSLAVAQALDLRLARADLAVPWLRVARELLKASFIRRR